MENLRVIEPIRCAGDGMGDPSVCQIHRAYWRKHSTHCDAIICDWCMKERESHSEEGRCPNRMGTYYSTKMAVPYKVQD